MRPRPHTGPPTLMAACRVGVVALVLLLGAGCTGSRATTEEGTHSVRAKVITTQRPWPDKAPWGSNLQGGVVISSSRLWRDFWSASGFKGPTPSVDFARHVALVAGGSDGGINCPISFKAMRYNPRTRVITVMVRGTRKACELDLAQKTFVFVVARQVFATEDLRIRFSNADGTAPVRTCQTRTEAWARCG